MTCLHCYAETSNGLALCEQCRMATSVYLEFVPVYFRNLARWRPGRAGSRAVPGSRAPKGVFPSTGDPVSNALDEVGADLAGWVKCLADDRGVEAPHAEGEASTVRVACWVFSEHLTSIATLEWAGEFVRRLSEHEARLRALTEKVAPGWYAGACRRCEHPTHVVPGLTWVTCGGCGATAYARDHLDTILDEARGWVAAPKRIAEAVVSLVDTEESVTRLHDRIRQWGTARRRKDGSIRTPARLDAIRQLDDDGDPFGPKRFRFGDVMDLVLTKDDATEVDIASAS